MVTLPWPGLWFSLQGTHFDESLSCVEFILQKWGLDLRNPLGTPLNFL